MKSNFWIIIIVILLGAIGFTYWYRIQVQDVVKLPAAPTDSAVQLIARLRNIKIDRSFFEDQRFIELVPFVPPSLEGIPIGKANPFSGASRVPGRSQPAAGGSSQ